MTMANFTYSGPPQTIAIAVGTAKNAEGKDTSVYEDVHLVPGKAVDLPGDSPLVESMVARDLLKPAPKAEPKAATTKPDTKKETK